MNLQLNKISLPRVSIRALCKIELFSVSIIPVLLLFGGVIDTKYNFEVLIGVFVTVVFLVGYRIKKGIWGKKDLGFLFFDKETVKYYVPFLFFALLLFPLSTYASKVIPDFSVREEFNWKTFWVYSVLGSALQEFLYRTYLWRLGVDAFVSPKIRYWVNVILFSGMHVFYTEKFVILSLTFMAGMVFTKLYMKRPNFILIWALHIITNAFVVHIKLFH